VRVVSVAWKLNMVEEQRQEPKLLVSAWRLHKQRTQPQRVVLGLGLDENGFCSLETCTIKYGTKNKIVLVRRLQE
jgi:hypothetical protein